MNKKEKINKLIEANYEDFAYLFGVYRIKEAPSYESLRKAAQKQGPKFRNQVEAILKNNKVGNYEDYNDQFDDPVIVDIDGNPIPSPEGSGGGGFNIDPWLDGLSKLFDTGVGIWKGIENAKDYDPGAGQNQPPPGYYQHAQSGISQQTLMIGGGILLLLIIVLIFKK